MPKMFKLKYNNESNRYHFYSLDMLYEIEDRRNAGKKLLYSGSLREILEQCAVDLCKPLVKAWAFSKPFRNEYKALLYINPVKKRKSGKSVSQRLTTSGKVYLNPEIIHLPEEFRDKQFRSCVAFLHGPYTTPTDKITGQYIDVDEWSAYKVAYVGRPAECIRYFVKGIIDDTLCDSDFLKELVELYPITSDLQESKVVRSLSITDSEEMISLLDTIIKRLYDEYYDDYINNLSYDGIE